MREIKYRGMGIDGGWNHGLLTVLKRNYMRIEKGHYISNSMGLPFAYHVRPETVGQYTGLKDKNGKEIYEGDVLYDPKLIKCSEAYSEVIWDLEMGRFDAYGRNLWVRCSKTEVIGNVWEHPHLLEGRDEA